VVPYRYRIATLKKNLEFLFSSQGYKEAAFQMVIEQETGHLQELKASSNPLLFRKDNENTEKECMPLHRNENVGTLKG